MVWLFVVGLLAWAGYLTVRLDDASRRADGLERRLLELKERLDAGAAATPAPAAKPAGPARAASDPRASEPLRPAPLAAPIEARRPAAEALEPPPSLAAAPLRRPSKPPPREAMRAWLEQNGLAWGGGAALALGGLFLVTYAAQRGVFSPPLRIAAAVAVGALLLLASEFLKRRSGHALAAALAAGAGAATLYAAAWAAHGLYGLIGVGLAGGLLAVASLGLLALAFRHGESLAILALAGGFLAPAVSGLDAWSPLALTAYLSVLTATGHAVAAARRWGRAGIATLVGAALWALAGLFAGGALRVAVLAVAPVAFAFAAVAWGGQRERDATGPRTSFELLPAIALLMAAGLLIGLWLLAPSDGLAPAAAGAIVLVGLSAVGVRRDLMQAPLQLAAYAACSGVALWGVAHGAGAWDARAWMGVLVLAVVGAGVVGALGRASAEARWAGGAPAAALVIATAMAGPTQALGWAPEALTAALLFAAAAVLVRGASDRTQALAPAIWIWTSGAAALAALNEALDPRVLPLGAAAMALGVSLLHARLRWRGFAAVTLAAGLAALTALVSPPMFAALQAGRLAWPLFAAAAAGSAAMVYAAARITGRAEGSRASAEALSTGALMVLLAGAFLLLRPWGPAGGLDPFLEASLRTVLLLVAGLTAALSTPAAAESRDQLRQKLLPAFLQELYASAMSHGDPGIIGRWRGQAILCVGLIHGVILQVLVFDPIWPWGPQVVGPPVLDSLLLGFLAPAAILAAATLERVSLRRPLLAAYGLGAAGFGALWSLLEVRRLFQGPTLWGALDLVTRPEAAAYGLLFLISGASTLWLGDLVTRRRLTVSAFAPQIRQAGRVTAATGLGLAVLVFGYLASPWWGPIGRPLADGGAAALLLALYAGSAAATLALRAAAAQAGAGAIDRGARLVGIAIVFALTNLVVRFGFRGLDMRPDLRDASLETWAFSAVWGLFGFGLLIYGAARRSNDLRGAGLVVLLATLAKIFLFDMSRLDGVVRAASFLAVGALLLGAAVLVRRLSARSAPPLDSGQVDG